MTYKSWRFAGYCQIVLTSFGALFCFFVAQKVPSGFGGPLLILAALFVSMGCRPWIASGG
jgi:L-lactate permease